MKRLVLALPLVFGLAACDQQMAGGGIDRTVGTSALAGAAIGAAVSNDDTNDRLRGAAIGAGVGAAAGAVANRATNNRTCTYRNTTTGATYQAACP